MIIITGASKGVGQYLLRQYVEKGKKVYGTYCSTPPKEYPDNYIQLDVSNYDAVEKWVKSIESELSELVLINCAGISYSSFAHKADIHDWKRVIEVNLIGTFNLIRVLLPYMRKQNYGRIINFSSVVAQIPTPGVSAYAASKSALWGLSKSLACENANKGITVNCINLGYSNVGMGVNNVSESFRQNILDRIPVKRFCEPQEILNTIDFLINTEYVNGSDIDINGNLL